MRITLTETEMLLSALLGVVKRQHSLTANHRNRFGTNDPSAWEASIIGVMGEFAVAKALDCFPRLGKGPDYSGDVGRFEVRSTEYPSGSLIVHPEDIDERLYVLVCRLAPNMFDIVGALPGRDAKRKTYWRTDVKHPAYFVPRQALKPLETWMV